MRASLFHFRIASLAVLVRLNGSVLDFANCEIIQLLDVAISLVKYHRDFFDGMVLRFRVHEISKYQVEH